MSGQCAITDRKYYLGIGMSYDPFIILSRPMAQSPGLLCNARRTKPRTTV
ncbi:MAG TPA: hypothetical protein VIY68_06840 [Steroidobacteraceae bacterium]